MFQQFLAPVIVLCFTVFAIYAITNNNWTLLGVGTLVPFALMLLSRPDWLLVGGVMTMMSQLTIPGLGVLANFHLYHLLLLGFGVVTMARLVISKESLTPAASRWFLYIFLGVLANIIYQRGFGLRILGDSKVGGGTYVQILAMVLFYFSSYSAKLTNHQWRVALVGMMVLTVLPLAASLLLILSNGKIYQQYYFVTADMGVMESFKAYNTGGNTRWSGFGGLSYLYLVPFLFFPFRGRYRVHYVFFIGLALFFAALTGFRSVLLQPVMFIGLAAFLKARNKMMFIVGTAMAALVILVPLALLAEHLPFPVQRVLSLIPFMPIDPAVRDVASATIDWRFMLWRRWFYEVPQYLVLGKGFAYDEGSYLNAMRYAFTDYDLIEPSVMVGDYHLGLFSGLAILGIPGMVALIGFWGANLIRHIKTQQSAWANPKFKQYHFVFLLMAGITIVYQLAAGAIVLLIMYSLLYLGLLNALANTRQIPPEPVRPPRPVASIPARRLAPG